MRSLVFRVGIGSILVLIGSANAETPTARRVALRWTPASSDRYTALIRHRDGTTERTALPEAIFTQIIEVAPGDCAVALLATNAVGEDELRSHLLRSYTVLGRDSCFVDSLKL